MTRPASNGSPASSRRPTGSPPQPEGRRLAATAAAATAGGAAFAVLMLLGLLLYERLWSNSTPALLAIAVLFGAAGLYAGWIAAMMVFSAVGGEQRA